MDVIFVFYVEEHVHRGIRYAYLISYDMQVHPDTPPEMIEKMLEGKRLARVPLPDGVTADRIEKRLRRAVYAKGASRRSKAYVTDKFYKIMLDVTKKAERKNAQDTDTDRKTMI